MNVTNQPLKHGKTTTLQGDGTREEFLTVRSEAFDDLSIFDGFPSSSGEVVAQLVLGGCSFEEAARARMLGAEWPILWIEGDVCPGTRLYGTQAFLVEGRPVSRVKLGAHVVGSMWSDDDADYCVLAGILPADAAATRGDQTTSCLQQIEVALQNAGMDFSHVVRTWFYLDKLLDWYDEFNVARTRFFEGKGVFDRLIPASTGIGARNAAGMALASGALAIRPRHDRVRIEEVVSPLQCAATDYRSSFSRAVEVGLSDRRLLMISGTASIAAEGASMYTGDVAKQIHLTLDVVEGILKSREMDWSNTVRAVGYFRDMSALPVFEACCRERKIQPLPIVPVHATVCRDDLLFEIELDAISVLELGKEKEDLQ